jgi:hypothetical protein
MSPSHSESSAGELVDQDQFLYYPVLKCVYIHLANKFLQKKTTLFSHDCWNIFQLQIFERPGETMLCPSIPRKVRELNVYSRNRIIAMDASVLNGTAER